MGMVTVLLVGVLCAGAWGQEWNPAMRTFGHSVKNAELPPNQEVTVLEHTCGTAPCVITQLHAPAIAPRGGDPEDWEKGYYTFYIDGEEQFTLLLLELAMEGLKGSVHGHDNNGGPWGSEYFGKTASRGGVYSTLRVPFGKSIKVTIHGPPSQAHTATFWTIIRGVEAYHVSVGGVQLPGEARLKVGRFGPQRVQNLDLIPMANFTQGTRGALVAVMFSAESPDYTYLEACMRLVHPTGNITFLSSGAEDYFLSAYYFEEGMFKTSESGLTFFDKRGSLSAYKVHDRDLVLTEGGGSLTFRVGESTGGCGALDRCPSLFCETEGQRRQPFTAKVRGPDVSTNVTYTTLTLYYEWPQSVVRDATGDVAGQLFNAVKNGYLSVGSALDAYDAACPKGCTSPTAVLALCGKNCFATSDDASRLAAALLERVRARK